MSHPRAFGAALLAALIAVASFAIVASSGAAGPPLPKAANGKTVEVVGTGVPTPTAFAFTGTTVFAGSGPNEETNGPGGLFTVAGGKATKVPNTPPIIFGLAWKSNKLYVSTGPSIVALSGWNGTTFSSESTVYASKKKGFPGFNGLAFGPEGRLYAGLALNQKYDHSADPFKPSQGVVSMTAAGKGFKSVSSGIRQPFQLAFPQGSKYPYVTSLSQDKGKGSNSNDAIMVAKPGDDFGFPTCTWLTAQMKKGGSCEGFDEPAIFLPPHASPMGIGSIGKTLYVSLFGGTGKGPEVVEMSEKGQPQPFLTGFAAPVIALGVSNGSIYVGDLTGSIYKVAAK
jgi:glucose/arabinose dehydrogenase